METTEIRALKGVIRKISRGVMEIRLETGPIIKWPCKGKEHIDSGDEVQILYNYIGRKVVDVLKGNEEINTTGKPTQNYIVNKPTLTMEEEAEMFPFHEVILPDPE